MKKTTRIAALLAAAALIFGSLFCSCSDSDGDPEETIPPPGDEVVTPTTATFNFAKKINDADNPYAKTLASVADTNSGKPKEDTTLEGENGTTLVIGNDNGSNISFKYNQDSGFTIKTGKATSGNALTVKGVKGKVTVKVQWAIAGAKKANDRTLTLKAGDQTDERGNALTAQLDDSGNIQKSDDNKDLAVEGGATSVKNTNTITYDFGSGGTVITIDASNEIIVETIVIAAAQN